MTCPKCYNSEHLKGARFCMICGAQLENCDGCVNEEKGRDTEPHCDQAQSIYLPVKSWATVSLGGQAETDDEGGYRSNSFLVWKPANAVVHE